VLDRLDRRGVEPGPPPDAELGRQRVGDEGVGEAQPPGRGRVLGQEARLDRRVQGVEGAGRRGARHVGEHVELDRQAEDGRGGEELLGLGRQHPDAPADDVEGRPWHPGAARRVEIGEAVLPGEQLDQLADEERVPSRALVDEGGHLVRHGPVVAPLSEPGADVSGGQAGEVDALGTGLARQLGQARHERRGGVGTHRADVRQQQHRRRRQGSGDELEGPKRRGVCPLEVVDDEQQRACRRAQGCDHRAVESRPVGGRVDGVVTPSGGADAVAGGVADDARRRELFRDLGVAPPQPRHPQPPRIADYTVIGSPRNCADPLNPPSRCSFGWRPSRAPGGASSAGFIGPTSISTRRPSAGPGRWARCPAARSRRRPRRASAGPCLSTRRRSSCFDRVAADAWSALRRRWRRTGRRLRVRSRPHGPAPLAPGRRVATLRSDAQAAQARRRPTPRRQALDGNRGPGGRCRQRDRRRPLRMGQHPRTQPQVIVNASGYGGPALTGPSSISPIGSALAI